MLLGQRVSEAVAKVQGGGVPALSITTVCASCRFGSFLRQRKHRQPEMIEQGDHLRLHRSARRDDQGLGDRSGGHQECVGFPQRLSALQRARCSDGDFDQRGRINDDQAGRPLSS